MIQNITRAELLQKIAQVTRAAGDDPTNPPRFSLLADCKLGKDGDPYQVRAGLTGTIDNSLIPHRRMRSALPLNRVAAGLDRSQVWITVDAAQAWCDAHQDEP
jgi:hypothetical protein